MLLLLTAWLAALTFPVAVRAETGVPPQPTVHIVQRGETLFSIARRYGTTVEAISHANGIADPRHIYVGQRLSIPAILPPVENWSVHVVRPGETLAAVAAQYGLSMRTLAQANRLVNPHLLYVGQVLRLPDPRAGSGALHTVQQGETLLAIALHYGVPLWDIIEANGITNPAMILPGQWLLVPGLQPSWLPLPFTSVDLSPLPVAQGETLLITVHTAEPMTLQGSLFDRTFPFFEEDGVYHAVVGVHALQEPGLYELTLTATDGAGGQTSVSVGVVVAAGGYGYERINLPPSRSNLLDPTLVAAEQARVAEVQTILTPVRRWHGPFRQPVEAALSSYFGTRRSYNDGPYTSYHAGLDFDAGQGTAVLASADGTVVLAEPLAVRGNAVVLDHGWGVMTGYWHLSEILVTVGQEVHAGDVIGRVGNTGLSTGAHLHWEVWAGGVSVDGRQWLPSAYPWTALDAEAP